jgi:hypothetical protein
LRSKDTSAPHALRRKSKTPVRFAKQLDTLAEEREKRISEIATLRRAMNSKFLDDASRLLSGRYWSRARVQSRQQLLQTADWLIALARNPTTPADFAHAKLPAVASRPRRTATGKKKTAAPPAARARQREPEPV